MHQAHVHRNAAASPKFVTRRHKKKRFLTLLEQTETLLKNQVLHHPNQPAVSPLPEKSSHLPQKTTPSVSSDPQTNALQALPPESSSSQPSSIESNPAANDGNPVRPYTSSPFPPTSEPSSLRFELEPHAPFEQEPIYPLDDFSQKERAAEKTATPPPPDFQQALAAFPPNIKASFQTVLHGEIIGIWPIRSDSLKK